MITIASTEVSGEATEQLGKVLVKLLTKQVMLQDIKDSLKIDYTMELEESNTEMEKSIKVNSHTEREPGEELFFQNTKEDGIFTLELGKTEKSTD